VDACVLAGPLRRNLLLSLAEAGLFRVRWSGRIMDEAERAMAKMIAGRGLADAAERAARARAAMERAFRDAAVTGFEGRTDRLSGLPDPGDAHVIAAAVEARASVIATDNIRHFPARILAPLDLEARTADAVLADAIDLDAGPAVAAVRRMHERFQRPEMDAPALLSRMEAVGLRRTADALRGHLLPI
jgi:PIN domain-containing protein